MRRTVTRFVNCRLFVRRALALLLRRRRGVVADVGDGSAPFTQDFFFQMSDANHDRTVNALDFNVLAANFGKTGRTFSQGDFNFDGKAVSWSVEAFGRNCVARDQLRAKTRRLLRGRRRRSAALIFDKPCRSSGAEV